MEDIVLMFLLIQQVGAFFWDILLTFKPVSYIFKAEIWSCSDVGLSCAFLFPFKQHH